MPSLNTEVYPFKVRRAATIDTSSRKARSGSTVAKSAFNYIYVPSFDLAHTWLGASYLLKRYFYTVASPISIIHWPAFDPAQKYILVAGYNVTGGDTVRFKLWRDVGEQLFAPLYNRQLLPVLFFIEVWSIEAAGNATLDSPLQLDISRLSIPSGICGESGAIEDMLSRDICNDPIYDFDGVSLGNGDTFDVDDCGNVTRTINPAGFLIQEPEDGGGFILQEPEDGGGKINL